MKYLLLCVVSDLEEFRLPELESIAQLFDIRLSYDSPPDVTRPFMIVDLDGDDEARLLGSRAVGVRSIWRHWADALTYEELHEKIKAIEPVWSPYATSPASWKFCVGTFGRKITPTRQVEVVNSFSYMEFLGPINLKEAELEIGVWEEYPNRGVGPGEEKSKLVQLWMGLKVCDGQRDLIDKYTLKRRKYIGNTSMEAEVSLYMANQALASPGKLVYDPFVGTGSMLLMGSAFGALSVGSDIDGRQVRGKGATILDSAAQYGIESRILDTAVFDVNQHPFRIGGFLDAVVTDPPYGVRAGAKKTGMKPGSRLFEPRKPRGNEELGWGFQLPDYIPPSHAWELTSVLSTLVTFSLFLLKPGGRLVFFLPSDEADYADVDVPSHPNFKLISNSKQAFGEKWSRRLITLEKVGETSEDILQLDRGIERVGGEEEETVEELKERMEKLGVVVGKKPQFRERYFDAFRPMTTPPSETEKETEKVEPCLE